ncbi:hypothetical protein Btru_003098 [Bulinus truncatus]|nr:hypothetical protein Btru_003098 [Bulinus truncatus]
MSNLESVLREINVENLFKVVSSGQIQYVSLTKKYVKNLVIEVTNGNDLWITHLDDSNIEEHIEANGMESVEKYLQIIRDGFSSDGTISVGHIANKIKITFGKGSSAVSLDLFEAKASEKKSELQSVLLSLANRVSLLETELSKANDQVSALKAEKSSNRGVASSMMSSPVKHSSVTKAKVSKAGMSVVNPLSKKRKAAAGVIFDAD